MVSMNLIAHVFSAVAFAFLVVWVVQLKKKHEFLLKLLKNAKNDNGKTMVDWPGGFLKKFGSSFGVPVEIRGPSLVEPIRIYPQSLVSLFFSHEITFIRVMNASHQGNKLTVELKMAIPVQEISEWQPKLQKVFNDKVNIVLC